MAGSKMPGGRSALQQYLREVRTLPVLGRDEELALCQEYARTKDPVVADKIVRSHLRLVVKVARDHSGLGSDLEDMISAGNLGVLEALKRFDPSRGFKFSTYAVWWIRQGICKNLQDGRSIVKISAAPEATKAFYGLAKAEAAVRAEAGTALPQEVVDEAVSARLGVRARELEKVRGRLGGDVSLNATRSCPAGNRPLEFIDTLTDGIDFSATMEEEQHRHAQAELVQQAVARLDEREQTVIKLRFLVEPGMTLARLGDQLGVSRERVRQIEEKALLRLRRLLGQLDHEHLAA